MTADASIAGKLSVKRVDAPTDRTGFERMAHGFNCKRCGFQEASHDFPDDYPGICRSYVSPDKLAEKKMWEIEREQEAEQNARKYRGPAYEH